MTVSKIVSAVGRASARALAERRGSMVTMTAITMSTLVGFAGLGVDLSLWFSERRTTQNIADSAAVAAAYARQNGGDISAVESAARAAAEQNGYQQVGDNHISVQFASGGTSVSTPHAIVTVGRRAPLYFLKAFMDEGPMVSASATGGVRALGSHCVIGLDNDESRTVEFIGTTLANIGCGVASNSSSASSLYVGGNATLIANPAQANGDIVVSGSGELITQLPPLPYSPRVEDPFADRAFPTASGACDHNGLVVSGNESIGPVSAGGTVRICGDLTVKPGATLTMAPGIYFVDEGNVLFQGNVNGTGVTIVTTGASPSSIGEFDIRAQSVVTLSAPTAGPYQGIVFHQDGFAEESGDNKFNGGGSLTLAGAIYIPSQPLTYNGGADADGCTVIVGRIVKFSGTSYLRNTLSICDSVGLTEENLPTQEQVVLLN